MQADHDPQQIAAPEPLQNTPQTRSPSPFSRLNRQTKGDLAKVYELGIIRRFALAQNQVLWLSRAVRQVSRRLLEENVYKNLSSDGLGVSCRQNELIELALTYGFRGIEVDIAEMQSRADRFDSAFARRFIDSAKTAWNLVVGTFKLPVKIGCSDPEFLKVLDRVTKYADLAENLEAKRCYIDIAPASTNLPYHENFELHRTRISKIADILGAKNVRIGLGINANPAAHAGKEFQFVHQAEALLTMIKTIGHESVGLALDTWHWTVGGGGLDQIQELSGSEVVCVRLADVPADVDIASIKDHQRLLPGQSETSIASGVISHLKSSGYEGPVAVYPHSSQFSGVTRDNIVQQASTALTRVFEEAGVAISIAKASAEVSLAPGQSLENAEAKKDEAEEEATAAAE